MIIKSMKHSIMAQYDTCIRYQDEVAFVRGKGRGREVKDDKDIKRVYEQEYIDICVCVCVYLSICISIYPKYLKYHNIFQPVF